MGRNNIHIHLVICHLCSPLLLAVNKTVVKFYIDFELSVRDNIIKLKSLTWNHVTICHMVESARCQTLSGNVEDGLVHGR